MPAIPNRVFRVDLNMALVFSADIHGTQESALSAICFLSLTHVFTNKWQILNEKLFYHLFEFSQHVHTVKFRVNVIEFLEL